jgi:hypothetical protein
LGEKKTIQERLTTTFERERRKKLLPPPRKSKVYRILGAGEVAIQRMSGVFEKKSIKK